MLQEIIVVSICVLFTAVNFYIYREASKIHIPEAQKPKENLNYLVQSNDRTDLENTKNNIKKFLDNENEEE
jgi:hypothetical protein